MPTVRTTMRPDQTLEVDDAEYIDLKRQGLLVEEEVPPAPAAPAAPEKEVPPAPAAPATPAKKTSGTSGGKGADQ
ncbi:hypothetical protein [Streptomyces spinosirectus]